MSSPQSATEQYYFREQLFENIIAALKERGIEKITRKDIADIDEFHVRGAAVSLELAKEVGFDKHLKILDVGCGIGGPARMLADEFSCHVTGIDLTNEFIRTASLLSKLVGLQELTHFIQADALKLPFTDEFFDVAWTQHVQMNIENKKIFYLEIKRALKKNGTFIYYDIFKKNAEPLHYPLPWASEPSMSHMITTAELEKILDDTGFNKIKTKDQTTEAIHYFTEQMNRPVSKEVSQRGLSLLIEHNASEKFANLLNNIKEGKVELQSGIYQKR